MSQIKAGTCRACGRNLVQVVGERVYHPASVDLVSAPCPALIPMDPDNPMGLLSSDVPEDQFVPIGHVVSDARKRLAEAERRRDQALQNAGRAADGFAEVQAELHRVSGELTALRVAVIELATKHGIPSDELYAAIGGQS